MDTESDLLYQEIKFSMKNIIDQTNSILCNSITAFTKIKSKLDKIEEVSFKPSELLKPWFQKRNIETITMTEFIETILKEAGNKNLVSENFLIEFSDEDVEIFGKSLTLSDLFDALPNYFISS